MIGEPLARRQFKMRNGMFYLALKQAVHAESYTQIPEAANNYIVYDRNKKM